MKFAYLIIAHNEPLVFSRLISLLDDSDNDIYIMIDKKSNIRDFNSITTKFSNVFFVPRVNVKWGDYSQIQAELILLTNACRKKYDYYHLLSGVDLPIKSNPYIQNFFENHNHQEFVGIMPDKTNTVNTQRRYKYYHFLKKYYGKHRNIASITDAFLIRLQQYAGIDRTKKFKINYMGGSNWFSITHSFASYVVSKQKEIYNMFRFTDRCDEIFLQTLFYNSSYYSNAVVNSADDNEQSMRLIDWKRGQPYTWRMTDLEEIMSSQMLFARKFSTVDADQREIVNKIYSVITRENVQNKRN